MATDDAKQGTPRKTTGKKTEKADQENQKVGNETPTKTKKEKSETVSSPKVNVNTIKPEDEAAVVAYLNDLDISATANNLFQSKQTPSKALEVFLKEMDKLLKPVLTQSWTRSPLRLVHVEEMPLTGLEKPIYTALDACLRRPTLYARWRQFTASQTESVQCALYDTLMTHLLTTFNATSGGSLVAMMLIRDMSAHHTVLVAQRLIALVTTVVRACSNPTTASPSRIWMWCLSLLSRNRPDVSLTVLISSPVAKMFYETKTAVVLDETTQELWADVIKDIITRLIASKPAQLEAESLAEGLCALAMLSFETSVPRTELFQRRMKRLLAVFLPLLQRDKRPTLIIAKVAGLLSLTDRSFNRSCREWALQTLLVTWKRHGSLTFQVLEHQLQKGSWSTVQGFLEMVQHFQAWKSIAHVHRLVKLVQKRAATAKGDKTVETVRPLVQTVVRQSQPGFSLFTWLFRLFFLWVLSVCFYSLHACNTRTITRLPVCKVMQAKHWHTWPSVEWLRSNTASVSIFVAPVLKSWVPPSVEKSVQLYELYGQPILQQVDETMKPHVENVYHQLKPYYDALSETVSPYLWPFYEVLVKVIEQLYDDILTFTAPLRQDFVRAMDPIEKYWRRYSAKAALALTPYYKAWVKQGFPVMEWATLTLLRAVQEMGVEGERLYRTVALPKLQQAWKALYP